MLARAAEGTAREGDWLVAEHQTAGRGRQGRAWLSPAGNFYGSTIVELRPGDPPAPTLSLAVGLGLFTAVGDPAQLKWPNDLLIYGAKVAGVLLERQGDTVVIGIGVNLASAPDIAGKKVAHLDVDGNLGLSVEEMLEGLIQWIPWAVAIWRDRGLHHLVALWEMEAHVRGTLLETHLPDGTKVEGRFGGLTVEGALRLELPDGTTRIIHAGDIFLL